MKSFIKVLAVVMALVITLCSVPLSAGAKENSAEIADKNLIKLPSELLKSEYYYEFTDLVISQKDNCFYAVSENNLYKYNFLTNEYNIVESYDLDKYSNITSRYISDDKIYLIYCSQSWSSTLPCYSEVLCYDLNTHQMNSIAGFNYEWLTAVGADDYGRIYVSGARVGTEDEGSQFLRLLDSSGEELSEISIEDEVYNFVGFDEERGTFFTNGYYNYYSWGFDHYMNALRAGAIDADNSIFYDSNVVMTVSQRGYNDRPKQSELISNDYLAIDASFYQTFYVISMESFVPGSGKMDVAASVTRDYDSAEYDNSGAIGTRSLYMEESESLIFCVDDKTVMECNPKTGKIIGEFNTQHNIYAMYEFGGRLLLFEKDGDDFYYCFIDIDRPEEISVTPDEVTIEVGEQFNVNASVDGIYTPDFVWESENPCVATVNEDGTIFGWQEGRTTITVSSETLPAATIEVVVTKSSLYNEPALNICDSLVYRADNEGSNNYGVWSSTVKSYITENEGGSFTVVNAANEKVYVDIYSADFNRCIDSIVLDCPLSLFGGYYSGEKYNFLVFGQANESESNNNEVVRVQKYSKNWELLDSLSLYGENTYIPFEAGSLRMTEAQGLLYVHTCHEMYADEDAVNHQANMSFVVDTETTELVQIFSDVLNLAQAGYVSHSFNQFVASDDEYIYRVDHGDANPRGISITKIPIGGDITDVEYAVPVAFEGGYGYNQTGASIGGVVCSTNNIIIAGNRCIDSNNLWSSNRNIFVSITSKDFYNCENVTITDYDEDGDITALTPHLVKLGEDQFLLLWEEYNESDYTYKTKMVTIDSSGNMSSDIVEIPYRLSDCAPILASDYTVKWFVSDTTSSILCSVNPFKLNEIEILIEEETTSPDDETGATENTEQDATDSTANDYLIGDANTDGKINIRDATLIQKYLAKVVVLDDSVLEICDFNGDLKVNIKDVTAIQKFIAKL